MIKQNTFVKKAIPQKRFCESCALNTVHEGIGETSWEITEIPHSNKNEKLNRSIDRSDL